MLELVVRHAQHASHLLRLLLAGALRRARVQPPRERLLEGANGVMPPVEVVAEYHLHFVDAGGEEREAHVQLHLLACFVIPLISGGPVDEGVVDEGLQQCQQRLLVAPQHPQCLLTRDAERALQSGESHRRLKGLGHPIRDELGDLKLEALLEAHVPVDVHHLARAEVHEDVVEVAVAEARDVADHAHHREGACVHVGLGPQLGGRHARAPDLLRQKVPRRFLHELRVHALEHLVGPLLAGGHARDAVLLKGRHDLLVEHVRGPHQ
mmetsp:Transcript_35653/g.73267  ORF Transcript_35653/g.73267 Transcript_35653/m.73267 type:complete len:266 (+) Transcript_35653:215-1012(+)